jgi:hypothetical protein
MLVACRLAGLSALEGHYAGVSVRAQFRRTQPVPPMLQGRDGPAPGRFCDDHYLPKSATLQKGAAFLLVGRRHSRGSNGDLFPPEPGLAVGVTPSRVVADAG